MDGRHTTASLHSPRITVVVLAVANTLCFVDRLLPSILLDPIRKSLAPSDTQMGLSAQDLCNKHGGERDSIYCAHEVPRGERVCVSHYLCNWGF
jgi:hypothetical protein